MQADAPKIPAKRKPLRTRRKALLRNHIANGFLSTLIWLSRRLPYVGRVKFFGWASAHLISPLIRVPKAYRAWLSMMFPEMSPERIADIARGISDNSGRSLMEMYSGEEFQSRIRDLPLEGDGVDAIQQAREDGRPIVFTTAHFGNYNAARGALIASGFEIGTLYRPPSNPLLNAQYVKYMGSDGGTLFPRDRKGLSAMVRHLKSGKPIKVLFDLHVKQGGELMFFGKPTMTSLSPAELALRYDALLVPFYGIRQPDGLSFRVQIDAPIPHSTPEAMMQTLNDGLEALVRQYPEQWFYAHKRWRRRHQNSANRGDEIS